MAIILASMLFLFFSLTGCIFHRSSASESENVSDSADLSFTVAESDSMNRSSQNQNIEQRNENLISDGWEGKKIENGQLPDCFNFKPLIGTMNNNLEIVVGRGTSVAIKLMNLRTDECDRYVFINSGSTYKIENIPEGKYYLKIAYGRNWYSKEENGKCIGKFTQNAIYKKGEDIMDFYIKYTKGGYSIPSFRLELDVIQSYNSNSFNSQEISEEEFNQ